jgi:membrane-bound inhibitor of C-type lysozyme
VQLTSWCTRAETLLSASGAQQKHSGTYFLWHEGKSTIVSIRQAAEMEGDLLSVARGQKRCSQHSAGSRDIVGLTLCGTRVKVQFSAWGRQWRCSATYVLWHKGESAVVSMGHTAERQSDLHPVAQR